MNMIINFIAFQVCWVACVWGGAQGYWWLGPVSVLAFAAWELARARNPMLDIKLLAAVIVIGFIIDSAYIQAGLLRYATPVPFAGLAPVWIVAMWAGFALTLNHSLAWLKRNRWLAVAFGAGGGPLAYWIAGKAWDAVFFTDQRMVLALVVIAVVWAVATPLLLALASRFEHQEEDSV